MDKQIVSVYAQMFLAHRSSADDIVVTPALRNEFLSHSRQLLGTDVAEDVLLRRLINLRKQSKLPRPDDVLPA